MMREILMVFGVSALPISELRGAIPLGISMFGLSPILTYAVAVLGNIFPVFFLLGIVRWLVTHDHHKKGIIKWVVDRATSKLLGKYEALGEIALVLFVAIPLPVSGAYTGAVASVLLGIPPRRAMALISAGVLISGIIVTILTLGIDVIL